MASLPGWLFLPLNLRIALCIPKLFLEGSEVGGLRRVAGLRTDTYKLAKGSWQMAVGNWRVQRYITCTYKKRQSENIKEPLLYGVNKQIASSSHDHTWYSDSRSFGLYFGVGTVKSRSQDYCECAPIHISVGIH